jgi:hypothetical protein
MIWESEQVSEELVEVQGEGGSHGVQKTEAGDGIGVPGPPEGIFTSLGDWVGCLVGMG